MTTLVEEEPFAAVVVDKFIDTTCAKCFAWVCSGVKENVKLIRCANCESIFYCGEKCLKADFADHKKECTAFCENKFIPSHNTRFLARIAWKMMDNPRFEAFNGRTMNSLDNYWGSQKASAEFMKKVEETFQELRKFVGSVVIPTFESCLVLYSKVVMNSFGILDCSPECFMRGMGLYLGLSVHGHSCRPDAFVISRGARLVLRTTKENCVYSNKLTICYPSASFFHNTSMRRDILSRRFGIDVCNCERCKDEDADKKLTSGRPNCCPEGYFLLSDRRCSVCNRKMPLNLANDVETANAFLHKLTFEGLDDTPERTKLLASMLMKFFCEFEGLLSDENAYLFCLSDMIFSRVIPASPTIALSYGEFCARQARNRPHNLYGALLKTRIFCIRDIVNKSLKDRKAALIEAIEAVEVIYGKDHELTTELEVRQAEIGLEELGIH